MWYVVSAEEGAGLYMGLERQCSAEEFAARVADGTVEELLSFKTVKSGDVFYIPAGTIHAIGAGVLIYEIQQNSTLTYRLYDYMRRDKEGNLRELHVDKAMKVSKLEVYRPEEFDGDENVIGKCEYFTTKEYKISDTPTHLTVTDESYMAFTCVSGEGEISYLDGENTVSERLTAGNTLLAPAGAGSFTASGNMTLITVQTL
jgi:mannose-6-phosphate isomerase